MSASPELMSGISARSVETPRLKTYLLEAGSETGIPVVFVHGNVSSSRFFEETLVALDPKYHALAPICGAMVIPSPRPSMLREACETSPTTCLRC